MFNPPQIALNRIKQYTRRSARVGLVGLAAIAATATITIVTADASDKPEDAPPAAHGKPCTTVAETGRTANGTVVRCRPVGNTLKWWAEGISTATQQPSPPDRDHDGISDERDEFPDDPHNTPRRLIRLTCSVGEDNRGFDVEILPGKGADFTAVWAAKPVSCERAPSFRTATWSGRPSRHSAPTNRTSAFCTPSAERSTRTTRTLMRASHRARHRSRKSRAH
ncbi:hypothetical protein [Plantactinospora endophytica]|uniref:Ig-like domain-containing protein n=1 Tax=Plantactinospora endophytica TaxID=673535 RepID=A0ABQ4EEE0_9ACTN|nr:hypothetical protein [Plantactinospora endophytica]GIG93059.1 hypothetical protein Pen02_79950 [Plantactinospora endophytica]